MVGITPLIDCCWVGERTLGFAVLRWFLSTACYRVATVGSDGSRKVNNEAQRRVAAPLCAMTAGLCSALERLHASSFSYGRHAIVAKAIAAEPIMQCTAPARTKNERWRLTQLACKSTRRGNDSWSRRGRRIVLILAVAQCSSFGVRARNRATV